LVAAASITLITLVFLASIASIAPYMALAEQPPGTTYEKYGPRVDELLIKIY